MDIEGAEFQVLRRIIANNLLSLIDLLAVEWHDLNGMVLGEVSNAQEYKDQHQCINWIVEDAAVPTIEWGR
jgi:hypothetical protein